MIPLNPLNTVGVYGFCLLIFVMLCPQIFHPFLLSNYTFYDYHRIIQIVLFTWVTLHLVIDSSFRTQWIQCVYSVSLPIRLGIITFYILGMISSAFASIPSLGILWVAHCLLCVVLSVYIMVLCFHSHLKILLGGLMLFIGLYMSFEWMNFISIFFHELIHQTINTTQAIELLRFPTFSNPRFLGQVLSLTLPIVIIPAINTWQKNHKGLSALCMILAIGWWQMMWMNQSRALYLESVMTGLVILILFRRSALVYLSTQATAALLGLGLYLIMFHLAYHIPERSLHSFYSDTRLHLWFAVIHLIIKHPLLGLGPLNFYPFGQKFEVSHPHNAILFAAVEWGIPAVLCFIFVSLKGVLNYVQYASNNVSHLNIGLTGALIGGIIDAQFSGTLLMPVSQIVLSILVGVLASQSLFTPQTNHKKSISQLKSMTTLTLPLLAMIILIALTLPKIMTLPQIESALCQAQYQHSNRCFLIPQYFGDLGSREL